MVGWLYGIHRRWSGFFSFYVFTLGSVFSKCNRIPHINHFNRNLMNSGIMIVNFVMPSTIPFIHFNYIKARSNQSLCAQHKTNTSNNNNETGLVKGIKKWQKYNGSSDGDEKNCFKWNRYVDHFHGSIDFNEFVSAYRYLRVYSFQYEIHITNIQWAWRERFYF